MAPPPIGSTISLTAKQLLDRFEAVCTKLSEKVHVTVGTNVPHFGYSESLHSSQITASQKFAQFATDLEPLKGVMASAGHIRLEDVAANNSNKPTISYQRGQNSTIATIHIDHCPDAKIALRLAQIAQECFDLHPHAEILAELSQSDTSQHLALREQSLYRLEEATDELGRKLTELAATHSDQINKIELDLRTKYDKKEQSLENLHQKRMQSITDREEDLKIKIQEFETRESKYVRRGLKDEIAKLIESSKSVTLSDTTQKKRRIIHATCGISAMVSAIGIGVFLYKTITNQATTTEDIVKLSVFSFGLASTVIYYIRWNDRWFSKHAQAELDVKKLEMDILRASWLAELLQESDNTDLSIPDEVVKQFSSHLFEPADYKETHHPADDLLAFIKKVKYISASNDGVTVASTKHSPAKSSSHN